MKTRNDFSQDGRSAGRKPGTSTKPTRNANYPTATFVPFDVMWREITPTVDKTSTYNVQSVMTLPTDGPIQFLNGRNRNKRALLL
jgi:hypothetical protein